MALSPESSAILSSILAKYPKRMDDAAANDSLIPAPHAHIDDDALPSLMRVLTGMAFEGKHTFPENRSVKSLVFTELAQLAPRQRRKLEGAELARLNGTWTSAGGRLLIDGETKLPAIFEIMVSGAQLIDMGQVTLLESWLWGTIDLDHLNDISQYNGNDGQARLARDISIVTGDPAQNIQTFPTLMAKAHENGITTRAAMKLLGWNKIPIDWRRFLYFVQLGDEGLWESYGGASGYARFARDFFSGLMHTPWQIASAILGGGKFVKLGWGKQRRTHLDEEAMILRALLAGVESGEYSGTAGYDLFARDFFSGNSQKAWQVASSLLGRREFAELGWGRKKRTNVREQAEISGALLAGIRNGMYMGEDGYDRFALEFFEGESQKAWQVASSLLTEGQFAKLRWEKVKYTNVGEQDGIREALIAGTKDGIYVGEGGYDSLARDFFEGNSQKAWQVAKSLLTDKQFERLRWHKQKLTQQNDEASIRQALLEGILSGDYVGVAGYDRAAIDHFDGNSQKAWQVASSLLNSVQFSQLKWGRQKTTRVGEDEQLRGALIGKYMGEAGYDLFAMDHFGGYSRKAYETASRLLDSEDFSKLRWGKKKLTNVSDQAEIRRALLEGIESGGYVGKSGYDSFAKKHYRGNMLKAWGVARSLLSDSEFGELKWGMRKSANAMTVGKHERACLALLHGVEDSSFIGDGGYDRFALTHFDGDSFKAWRVAKAFLEDEAFAKLGWSCCKYTKVYEQRDLRKALIGERFNGKRGRIDFSGRFMSGQYRRAYFVARSLLSADEFDRLGWEGTEELDPDVEAALMAVLKNSIEDSGRNRDDDDERGSPAGNTPPLSAGGAESTAAIGLSGAMRAISPTTDDADTASFHGLAEPPAIQAESIAYPSCLWSQGSALMLATRPMPII